MTGPSPRSETFCVTYGTRGVSVGCSRFQRSNVVGFARQFREARDAPDIGGDPPVVAQADQRRR